MYQTKMYEGMLAETVTIHGSKGDIIPGRAICARI